MNEGAKVLAYYRRLPYTLFAEPMLDTNGSSYWVAEYKELRGCKTEGVTEAEAIANLQELFDEYIESRLEVGAEIPEPEHSPLIVHELSIVVRRRPSSDVAIPESNDTEETRADQVFEEHVTEAA